MRPRDERETRTNFDDIPVDSLLMENPDADLPKVEEIRIPVSRADMLVAALFIALLILGVAIPTFFGAR